MADGAETDDKTEAPSARRLERARDQGQAPLSTELPALAALSAVALVLMLASPGASRMLVRQLSDWLNHAHLMDPLVALRSAGALVAGAAAPFAVAALLAASVAVLAQTGFLMNPKAVRPSLSRLDPRRGLARLFGTSTLFDTGKSLLKLTAAGWSGWRVISDATPLLMGAVAWDAALLADRTLRLALHVMLAMLAAQALITVLDVLRTRHRHAATLRMTRSELRDEHKEMEGDPQIKGRIKRLRLQRARRRMLQAVPTATVVITNPTHYAVALSYDRQGGAAPRIVAKGVDEMAARIRDVARKSGVPLVANPPLARALFPHEVDREIPAEFYKPVAEIIAYVWRLRGRM